MMVRLIGVVACCCAAAVPSGNTPSVSYELLWPATLARIKLSGTAGGTTSPSFEDRRFGEKAEEIAIRLWNVYTEKILPRELEKYNDKKHSA